MRISIIGKITVDMKGYSRIDQFISPVMTSTGVSGPNMRFNVVVWGFLVWRPTKAAEKGKQEIARTAAPTIFMLSIERV
jgi:hypothetical protein